VNLGAVNYYFDSKENLRLEAFRYGFAPALQMRKDTQNYLDEAQRKSSIPAAEEALRKYIRRFLDDILAVNSGNWSLLMRELTMPSRHSRSLSTNILNPKMPFSSVSCDCFTPC